MIVIKDGHIVFLLGILYVLFSTLVLNILIRYLEHYEPIEDDEISELCKQFSHDKKYLTLFILLTGELIWVSLFVLIELAKIPMPDLVSRILDTGIHVPLVLLVSGLITRWIQKPILQKWKITENDINQSFFLITFFMDIVLFAFNWEMSLFIMAILIGKYIWLDSTLKDVGLFLLKVLKSGKYIFKAKIKSDWSGELVYSVMESIWDQYEERSIVADIIGLSMTIAALFFLIACGIYIALGRG